MTQFDLDRQVARATGESLRTITERGLVEPEQSHFDPEPDDALPQMIDWDQVDAQHAVSMAIRPRRFVHAA